MNNFSVLVISQNQYTYVKEMVDTLKKDLPGAPILYVLDRDTSKAECLLIEENIPYVKKEDGWGFDAGGAREEGLKRIPLNNHVLFLDGDRVPSNLSWEVIGEALTYNAISLIKAQEDFRGWFSTGFTRNPRIVPLSCELPIRDNHYDLEVYSCGLLLRNDARRILYTKYGEIFSKQLRGRFGEEDNLLGARVGAIPLPIGGFPSRVFVKGGLSIPTHSPLDIQVNREKFRILAKDLGYTTYRKPPQVGLKNFLSIKIKNSYCYPYGDFLDALDTSSILLCCSIHHQSNMEDMLARVTQVRAILEEKVIAIVIVNYSKGSLAFSCNEEGIQYLSRESYYYRVIELSQKYPNSPVLLISDKWSNQEWDRGFHALVIRHKEDAFLLLRSKTLVGPCPYRLKGTPYLGGTCWVKGNDLPKVFSSYPEQSIVMQVTENLM